MKRKLVLFFLMLAASMHAFAASPTQALARAIAKAEGFYTKGTKPQRFHNPGDIRASKGVHYPGQRGIDRQGYVIFKNDRAGFDALESLIDRIIAGDSKFYTVNSTLRDLSRKYATSPTWMRNVSKALHCEPNTPLFIILDTPPSVTAKANPHALDFVFQGGN